MKQNTRRSLNLWSAMIVGILLLLLCSSSNALINLYTDYLWFQSLDYLSLFTQRLGTQLLLGGIGALVAVGFLLINWALLPYLGLRKQALETVIRGQSITVSTRPLRLAFTLAAIVIGALFGLGMYIHWNTYLKALHGVAFGLKDPIFNMDISYYIFELPWYEALLGWGKTLIAITFTGALLRYSLFQQLKSERGVAHLSLAGASWLLLLSADRFLERFTLLQSSVGVVYGAGYTDINARMPVYIVEMVIFTLAAVILIFNAFARHWKLLMLAGLSWLVVSVISGIYPALIQRFTVEPNESVLERPYIEHNIAYTRYAYGLDTIQEQDYSEGGVINTEDIEANADILQNVRLWDYRPLLRTYGQLQEIRLYYTFNDVDVDRYELDGQLRAVMLSARELDIDQLADQAQTWINRHLIFTHGYGATLSPVNEISQEGLPHLLVRDIPPAAAFPELAITQPEIYFGESTGEYAVVNTTQDEFDYPQGDMNVYTRYTGPDGVRLGGFFQRLLLALRFKSSQLLLSPALTADSRVLFHRTIRERANTLMPLLWYDSDPYIVIAEGRLIWILDAYTWDDQFPYSDPHNGLNYIRNSVKVTVDAYTGETRFYLIDPTDPIAATYANIFPDLFYATEEMPQVLRDHWRYPETLFIYQSELYATYHMRDPQVFYNREDLWDIPEEQVETQVQAMEPYYVVMRLPGSDRMEFMMVRPYVPAQKDNMVAWFYADSDGANYGQLGIFKLSKDRLIYGPLQVEARVDQDPVISQQLSLWGQRGSRVLRGNLMVIPLNGTFLYVEPLYLEAESGQLPELKRVIVAYDDRVGMAPTLEEALLQVLTGTAPTLEVPGETPQGDLESLAQQAWEHYQAAQLCLQAGDWDCYGREQATLEAILQAMIGDQQP